MYMHYMKTHALEQNISHRCMKKVKKLSRCQQLSTVRKYFGIYRLQKQTISKEINKGYDDQCVGLASPDS